MKVNDSRERAVLSAAAAAAVVVVVAVPPLAPSSSSAAVGLTLIPGLAVDAVALPFTVFTLVLPCGRRSSSAE